MNRQAGITQDRRVRIVARALKVGVIGCLVFVPSTTGLLVWVAFGDFRLVRARRRRA